jgi:hypothetical protein
MAQHVKILGVLHIILGCFGVLGALVVLAVFGSIAGLLSMNPDATGDVPFVTPLIGLLGTGLTFFILLVSVPGIIIGIGLMRFRPWAKLAGIILSALDLLHIPFGTFIGAYGLWVLLQQQTEALFRPGAIVSPGPYGAQPPVR